MSANKARHIIVAADVPHVFDNACIKRLAEITKLPANADMLRFAAAIQDAAQRYLSDKAIPSDSSIRKEITALYSAANRHRYRETATRIDKLSQQASVFLGKRGNRVNLTIPKPEAFLDRAQQAEACEIIIRLLRVGGKRGKPIFHAPEPQQHPHQRDAERTFVMWLEVAYLDAVGTSPALTANPQRPRPFARMVQTCLDKIARGANAVELLNELHRRRKLQHKLQSGTGSKT